VLRLVDVRKAFGALVAVDGLSLEVGPGEIFGLLGPNGAGKTTTARLAVGLLPPDSGEVRIDLPGRPPGAPTDPEVRRGIGVAPQALALYEPLSGEENVRLFGEIEGLSGKTLDAAVERALEVVGLADRRRDRAGTYSGGMKRRLNLAMALVHDPALLILDEPTVGVDPQSRNRILESIAALRESGKSVVYTTHYMDEVERICDRVAIVDGGKLLALGTVDSLVREHGGTPTLVAQVEGKGEVRIRTEKPVEELDRIAAEGRVQSFSLERPDLETVFLNLTGRKLRDE
jgi:ABC-2 type transport system ATP-binding protein